MARTREVGTFGHSGIRSQPGFRSWTARSRKGWSYLVEAVFPFRAAIVRATNQVYYSLFARSYMYNNWIVIGQAAVSV